MTLKEARTAEGLTQKRLAELAGVNMSLIGKLEAGTYSVGNISARSYMGLCDALSVDPHDLLPKEKSDKRGGNFM